MAGDEHQRWSDTGDRDGIGTRVKLVVEPLGDTWPVNEPLRLRATLTEDEQPVSPPRGPNLRGSAEVISALDDESGLVESRLLEYPPGSGQYRGARLAAERPGAFDVWVVATGWTKQGGMYLRAFHKKLDFVATAPTRRDFWMVDFIRNVGNRHCEARTRRVADGQVVAANDGVNMARALRQVFPVPRERIALDSSDGSLYCEHVPNPQQPDVPPRIVRITEGGVREQLPEIPGVDLVGLQALAVDGERRRLWIGTRRQLAVGDLDSWQLLRSVTATVSGLAVDPLTGGAWATARLMSTPSAPHILHRIGLTPSGDLAVPSVRPHFPGGGTAPYQRTFTHPLRSGHVVFYGIHPGGFGFVRVDGSGSIVTTGSRVIREPHEMGIHPLIGAPWVAVRTIQHLSELTQFSPELQPVKTYSPAELDGMFAIWSVDVNAAGDVWVTGNDRVWDQINGRWAFPGAIGILEGGEFRRINAEAQQMPLVRTFR